uniref:Uncharacterized protein n=1 Tax=Utricularia reniformis TaxID=192314 RepID=A0A1Y0AZU3_9LAMI|nr:hypothetical protein AEK19_MT0376 [Utricularia reniformis]ART30648.1 hypothetical protein AEK19_MT0376 [Utricularia reniformis]
MLSSFDFSQASFESCHQAAIVINGLEMENFLLRSPSLSQSTRDFFLQRIDFGSRHSN